MANPVSNVTLGGLTYNKNDVKSAKKLEDGTYELIFNSGEKLTYPEQTPLEVKGSGGSRYGWNAKGNNIATTGERISRAESVFGNDVKQFPRDASVSMYVKDGIFYDDTTFNISNVMGATFTSSKDATTKVTLENSSNTMIDLSANDSSWDGDHVFIDGGANNSVKLDADDTARIGHHKKIEGPGEVAQKDYK